jgi:hypothetical protein
MNEFTTHSGGRPFVRVPLLLSLMVAVIGIRPAVGDPIAAASNNASNASAEPVVALDPFTVDTSKDESCKATNSASGTRSNTSILDLPESIEVIEACSLNEKAHSYTSRAAK